MAAKILIIALSIASAYASGGVSSFSYGVSDLTTGNVKSQHEKQVGENVVGQYSLLEPDGTKRVVEYSSNPQTGFNAVVRKDPLALHPAYQGLGYASSGLGYGAHSRYGPNSALGYGTHSGFSAHSGLRNRAHSGNGAHALNYGAHSTLRYGSNHNVFSASPLTYGSYVPEVSHSNTINHGGYTAPYAHGLSYGAGYGKYGAIGASGAGLYKGWSNGEGYGVLSLGW